MSIIDLFTSTNSVLDHLLSIVPKIIAFAAIIATLIPETTPIIGSLLHKIAFNIGKATNK